jgi:hypothetical protein
VANGFLQAETGDGLSRSREPGGSSGDAIWASAARWTPRTPKKAAFEHGCSWDDLARWKASGVIS